MFDIRNRITAILMALYVFFAGIPYGNEPEKVDFSVETKMGVCNDIEGNERPACNVHVVTENVGRPFIASSHESAHIYLYRIVDGKREPFSNYYLRTWHTTDVPHDEVIKNGQKRSYTSYYMFVYDYEPGDYYLEVKVEHGIKVHTEKITLP